MNKNVKAEQFRQNLINTINNSEIEVSTAYYILKDIFATLENTYSNVLQQEQAQIQEEKKNEEIEEGQE